MGIGDLSRINSNLQSMKALSTLQKTNDGLATRQLRLATGLKINQAEDDSASYSISKKLESKVRGQAQALANIGDAKSVLSVAEGSLSSVMDILQTMKEKTVQAANDSLGTSERESVNTQLEALTKEIHNIFSSTKFNGTNLLSKTTAKSLSFQVGDTGDATDTFNVTLGTVSMSTVAGGLFSAQSLLTGAAAGLGSSGTVNWTITNATLARNGIKAVDNAITKIADRLSKIGDSQKRLTFKMENLNTSMTNNEAARSRIADADFAKEQMEIVKLQIKQQTGTASLAQANSAPQSILSLF